MIVCVSRGGSFRGRNYHVNEKICISLFIQMLRVKNETSLYQSSSYFPLFVASKGNQDNHAREDLFHGAK